MRKTEKPDWHRVRSIFDDALRQPAEDRLRFVRNACGEDEKLSAEVESLLESLDSADMFLETPAVVQVAGDSHYSDQRLMAGEMLLHYEIRELLGSGGMGEVYLARDTRLNRNVAIKVLLSNFLPDAQVHRRLLREARAAALLEHPNICQTYEISETNEHSFIVMQYVVGTTLADSLAKGRIGISASLDLATQIADGLAEAHEQGIIHRDIKPANIIINDKGQAKILDFGLAKFIEAETSAETAQRLNSSGAVMGTVPFMSPEQLRGKAVDTRTDIFSVGALLYEMLAGKPAFNRDNNAETISSILKDEPDWLALPEALRPIVKRCLEKNIAHRYESAAQLADDLRGVRAGRHLSDNPVESTISPTTSIDFDQGRSTGKKRNFYFWQTSGESPGDFQPTDRGGRSLHSYSRLGPVRRFAAWIAPLILVATGAAVIWIWKSNSTDVAGDFNALRPVRLIAWRSGASSNATDYRVSNNGKMVAYSSSKHGGDEAIYVKQTSDGEQIQVTKDGWANVSPLWSPDDQSIAFVSIRQNQTGIYVSPTFGGVVTPLKVTERGDISLRHWARDGSAIFYEQTGNLVRLDLATRSLTKVTPFPDQATNNDRYFNVSPDEKQVVYCDTRDGQTDLWVMELGKSEATRVTNDKETEMHPLWHPDGERILYNVVRDDFFHINLARVGGSATPLQVTRGEGQYELIDVSADGSNIYYTVSEAKSDVSSVNVSTGHETEVAAESDIELWTDVSPDGKSIAYHVNGSPNPTARLYESAIKVRSSDGLTRQLPGRGFNAQWLPDSRHLALSRLSDTKVGDYELWLVDTVTGQERLLTKEYVMVPGFSIMPITRLEKRLFDFSPDGKQLVYLNAQRPLNAKIGPVDGGGFTDLTSNENNRVRYLSVRFSPDGRRIAIASSEQFPDLTQAPVWRIHVSDNGELKEVYSTTSSLRLIGWSPTGTEVILSTTEGLPRYLPVEARIIATRLTGRSRTILTLNDVYARTLTLSADGKTLAFVARNNERDDIWTTELWRESARAGKKTANSNAGLFYTNLTISPNGNTIFFDKQEQVNTISVLENFN